MSDAIGRDLAGARELILGFDAGCSTCSGIATRIEERVGDKLVIRNLRDPELMEWRREALGEAAPWAPTLFQVEGGKVRAWVGMKMGLALSRRLGPKDTWRVMHVLGELGAGPDLTGSAAMEALPVRTQEAVVGMSRGQFLKGVGGAAVAASVLSGGVLFPSLASAQTTSGTAAQQTLAKSIVRNSQQYKGLATQQSQVGATFDWSSVTIRVTGSVASVVLISTSVRRSVVANFLVNLTTKRVTLLTTQALRTYSSEQETVVMNWVDATAANPFSKVVIGLNYVVTADNRIISREQFAREVSARNNVSVTRTRSESCVSRVYSDVYHDSVFMRDIGCAVVDWKNSRLSEPLEIISKAPSLADWVCLMINEETLRSKALQYASRVCTDENGNSVGNVSPAPPIYRC